MNSNKFNDPNQPQNRPNNTNNNSNNNNNNISYNYDNPNSPFSFDINDMDQLLETKPIDSQIIENFANTIQNNNNNTNINNNNSNNNNANFDDLFTKNISYLDTLIDDRDGNSFSSSQNGSVNKSNNNNNSNNNININGNSNNNHQSNFKPFSLRTSISTNADSPSTRSQSIISNPIQNNSFNFNNNNNTDGLIDSPQDYGMQPLGRNSNITNSLSKTISNTYYNNNNNGNDNNNIINSNNNNNNNMINMNNLNNIDNFNNINDFIDDQNLNSILNSNFAGSDNNIKNHDSPRIAINDEFSNITPEIGGYNSNNTNNDNTNINNVNVNNNNNNIDNTNINELDTMGFSNPQYFSPKIKPSLSTSINNNAIPNNLNLKSNSISFQGGKSYGSQLGTSLNNIVSPSSTFDGGLYDDSPYGSYQGNNNSYNDSFLKSPLNSPSLKALGSPASYGSHMNPKSLSKENKLHRRRELHNAVERRRRDLIKEKIKELGTLIPPTLLLEGSKKSLSGLSEENQIKEIKANKATILNKSVDYITHLKDIMSSQDSRLSILQSKIDELLKLPGSQNYLNDPNNNNNNNNNNTIDNINTNINNNNNSGLNFDFIDSPLQQSGLQQMMPQQQQQQQQQPQQQGSNQQYDNFNLNTIDSPLGFTNTIGYSDFNSYNSNLNNSNLNNSNISSGGINGMPNIQEYPELIGNLDSNNTTNNYNSGGGGSGGASSSTDFYSPNF
ncbi:hypothetical protein B5S33_g638 [[Candida] boidinii]|nr:hypothetical protein B5S33_g638 [[Candida] boidinii]